MKAIIGRKVGMSQIFDEKGHVIPVTVIEAGPCVVTQKKTSEKDGYEAVQLGYEDIREAKLSKPELGHLNKAGVSPKKYLREFDLDNASELELGAIIKADTFKSGDFVDVTGTSKGHGYTGVIKRWNASRGRMTPVSYTHLDVYKRQDLRHHGGRQPDDHRIAAVGPLDNFSEIRARLIEFARADALAHDRGKAQVDGLTGKAVEV